MNTPAKLRQGILYCRRQDGFEPMNRHLRKAMQRLVR